MADESAITQEMRDAIGVESDPVTHEVERGAIIKFAQAIGDPNPLFNDEGAARMTRYGGLIAPPTFLRSMQSGPPKGEFESPYSAGLDGGSEWEYFETIRVGDRITVTNRIADLYERQGRLGNMVFIINETKYVNQFGQTVALQRTTGISYEPRAEGS
ncbi:MAG: MaoC family dehydratase N-terminal domain-containing protein [Chloroflexi bacterium]|nr:MaoC family dehydratase N-terminal domain-containing protein [Chloroflexota bacterium]